MTQPSEIAPLFKADSVTPSFSQVDRGADDWDETKHIKAGRTVTKADVTETPVTKTDVTETADNGNDGGVLPDRPEGRSRPRYSNASGKFRGGYRAYARITPCHPRPDKCGVARGKFAESDSGRTIGEGHGASWGVNCCVRWPSGESETVAMEGTENHSRSLRP